MSESSSLKEECHICHKQILIRELRKHIWDCRDGSRESDEDENDLMQSALNTSRSQEEITSGSATQILAHPLVTTTQSQSQSNSIASAPYTAASFASNSVNALDDCITETSLPTTSSTTNSDDDKMKVYEVVEKTVHYCRKNDINNPVEILRCLQLNMVTGRALEVEFAHEEKVGETNFIMVDRQNLSQTALDEISSLQDFQKTLEVQFYNDVMFFFQFLLF